MSDTGAPISQKIAAVLTAGEAWYAVEMKDNVEPGQNSYHVRFELEDTSGQLGIVVLRGGSCDPAAATPAVGSYDWCVAFHGVNAGHADCGQLNGVPHCEDFSSPYRVGVRRLDGGGPGCFPYTLKMSAGAGFCEGFTSTCGACQAGEARCIGDDPFTCIGGQFKGSPCPVTPCHKPRCVGNGTCQSDPLPAGAPCGDGSKNVCTPSATCGCTPGAKACNGSDAMTCDASGLFQKTTTCTKGCSAGTCTP